MLVSVNTMHVLALTSRYPQRRNWRLIELLTMRPRVWQAGYEPQALVPLHPAAEPSRDVPQSQPLDGSFPTPPTSFPYQRPAGIERPVNDFSTKGSSPYGHTYIFSPAPARAHSIQRGPTLLLLRFGGPSQREETHSRSLAKGQAQLSYRKAGIYGRTVDNLG